jgi:hypothetical protein
MKVLLQLLQLPIMQQKQQRPIECTLKMLSLQASHPHVDTHKADHRHTILTTSIKASPPLLIPHVLYIHDVISWSWVFKTYPSFEPFIFEQGFERPQLYRTQLYWFPQSERKQKN